MNIKIILLAIYLVMIIFVGVLSVPVNVKWGPEQKFDSEKFVPLWKLQEIHRTIDDYRPIFELNIVRLIYEIAIITLLLHLIYLIIRNKEKN